MSSVELPEREWLRLGEITEFWWSACEAKRANDSALLQRPGILFSKVPDSGIRKERIDQHLYAQDIEPILGDLTLDFERKLSKAVFDGRVHFKGKKKDTHACDHEIIPASEFTRCRGFFSDPEKNEMEPFSSALNEEATFASAMSNDGTKWYDVLVHRDEFLKWFEGEFPELYQSYVNALKSDPTAAALRNTADDAADRKSAATGKYLVVVEWLKTRFTGKPVPAPAFEPRKTLIDEAIKALPALGLFAASRHLSVATREDEHGTHSTLCP